MKNKRLIFLRLVVLGIAALSLFYRLDNYSLWDDEAQTALLARAILRTGDTSIDVGGGNIMAYQDGLMVRDGKDRVSSPLASALAALSLAISGKDGEAWVVRLPFAFAGLLCVSLFLWWIRKAPPPLQGLLFLAVLSNLSFFLYCRNARYYALILLICVAIGYLYHLWEKEQRDWRYCVGISVLFVLLYAAHGLAFFGVAVTFFVDFVIFRRWRLSWKQWITFVLPQLLLTAPLAALWNPFQTDFQRNLEMNSLWNRLTLLGWSIRDLNVCEFYVGGLILLALIMAPRDGMLRRLLVGGLTFLVVVSALSPQVVERTAMADVRYYLPVIPWGWWVGAWVLWRLLMRWPVVLWGAAVGIYGTNFFHGGLWQSSGLRSTAWVYWNELRNPIEEPYRPVAKWIREEVPEGSTVVVFPSYMMYPLMFHAPGVIYGWQFSEMNRRRYPDLPRIHFQMLEAPDYFILFGPPGLSVLPSLAQREAELGEYRLEKVFPVFWRDLFRPELPWRTFSTIKNFSLDRDAIYVYRRR
jgi:hypothetical protein